MKKRISAILLCFVVIFAAAACGNGNDNDNTAEVTDNASVTAAPAETSEPEQSAEAAFTLSAREGAIDFEDGKMGFIAVNEYPPDSSKDVVISVEEAFGSKALKIENKGEGKPYIGIDASSLLGSAVTELRTMEFTAGVQHPSGEFYAVQGTIYGYCGAGNTEVKKPWSVFLDTKNPNLGKFEMTKDSEFMTAGAKNIFVISLDDDTSGGGSVLYIDDICFLDGEGNVLPVDTQAGFDYPDGFGSLAGFAAMYELPVNGFTQDGNMSIWYTPGTDNAEDGMDLDIFKISSAIVFEMSEPKEDILMVAFGAGNGWNWTEYKNIAKYYENGKLKIEWSELGIVPEELAGDDGALKVYLGEWSTPYDEHGVTKVYLDYFKPAEEPLRYELPIDGHSMQQNGAMPEWITVGTDEREDGIPLEIFEKSTAFVLEMPEPQASIIMIAFGGGNAWNWSGGERGDITKYWSNGKLTVPWSQVDVDAASLHGVGSGNEGVKILVGAWGVYWEDHGVTAAYLEYWEEE